MRSWALRTKLLVFFLLMGVLPFAFVGMLSLWASGDALEEKANNQLVSVRDIKKAQIEGYFDDRRGDMSVLVDTVETMRSEAIEKLNAVREVKREAVESYFVTIEDQMRSFAEDEMVVDAMREFRPAFAKARQETGVTGEQLARMRKELYTYYTDQFNVEYANQNAGQRADVKGFFDQLDDDSIVLQYRYIQDNPNPLGSKEKLDAAEDGSEYAKIHKRVHPIVRNFLQRFGYYDIFLVDPDSGEIVYSVFKELDYSTSL